MYGNEFAHARIFDFERPRGVRRDFIDCVSEESERESV